MLPGAPRKLREAPRRLPGGLQNSSKRILGPIARMGVKRGSRIALILRLFWGATNGSKIWMFRFLIRAPFLTSFGVRSGPETSPETPKNGPENRSLSKPCLGACLGRPRAAKCCKNQDEINVFKSSSKPSMALKTPRHGPRNRTLIRKK